MNTGTITHAGSLKMSKNKTWSLKINKEGAIDLPPDLILHLRNMYGLKSKKRRFIKKVIKYYFSQALRELVSQYEKKDMRS
jgi:hypothetical protein